VPTSIDSNDVAKAAAIKSEHKALGVVCFGYFRYRNARFGCAEVHQAIQCHGRAGMTRVREIAQGMGYTMVHALTDCAFLQKTGITRAEAMRFTGCVEDDLGVPMDVEGVYRWLVLLPSKTHSTSSSVGVPNRYYGKFEDGTLKVRGIEVQRHSTPPFLDAVQEGMLEIFQQADDARGFLERIPLALRVAKAAAGRLIRREVEPEELGTMVQARMSVEEYRSNTGTKAAMRKLRDAGTERRPGEYVKYVVTRTAGPWEGRAMPVELMGRDSPWFGGTPDTYHADFYLRLLARSVETLLAPFGYTEDGLHAWMSGRSRTPHQGPSTTPAPTWAR
jgi:DNA polymerase-2